MNNVFRSITTIFMAIVLLISCDDKICDGVNCNNGVCDSVSGECVCVNGWQRDAAGKCSTMWTTKYVGVYAVSDTCTGTNTGLMTYAVTVTAGTDSSKTLNFSNFGNTSLTVKANHTNSTNLAISEILGSKIITGTGSIVDSLLVINYILNDTIAGSIDTCTATYN